MTITVKPHKDDPEAWWSGTVHLAPALVSFKERTVVRAATGYPLEFYMAGQDKVGLDSLQIILWLARRACGEPFLTLDTACEQFPTDINAFEVTETTPDEEADDPEA